MNSFQRSSMTLSLILSLCVLSLVYLCGCGGGGGGGGGATVISTRLEVSSDHSWETAVENYELDTPATSVRVEVRIRSFHHGSVLLTIEDSTGAQVYSRRYFQQDPRLVVGSDEYLDIAFTLDGVAGLYAVELNFSEFSGQLSLTLEDPAFSPAELVDQAADISSLLDPSFGNVGLASYSPFQAFGYSAIEDSAGRIVVAGTVLAGNGERSLAVWRFTAGGDLDTSFAGLGIYRFPHASQSSARGIEIDGSNRILVSGWLDSGDGDTDIVLVRLLSSGIEDPAFGVNAGFLALDLSSKHDSAVAVKVDNQGDIFLAGNTQEPDFFSTRSFVAKFTQAGDFDTTFGSSGIVESTNPSDRCFDFLLDSSQRPLLVGSRNDNLALWRYETNGTADSTFGFSGFTSGSAAAADEVRSGLSVAIHPIDGSIAVGGHRAFRFADYNAMVWRFQVNGAIETTFSGIGLSSYTFPDGVASFSGVSLDEFGTVTLVGTTHTSELADSFDASATVWKYESDGSLMTAFGSSGVEFLDVRTNVNVVTSAAGLAVDSAGSLIVVGSAVNIATASADLSVWRLLP